MKQLLLCVLLSISISKAYSQTKIEKAIIEGFLTSFLDQCSIDSIVDPDSFTEQYCLEIEKYGLVLLEKSENHFFDYSIDSLNNLRESGLSLIDSTTHSDFFKRNESSMDLDSIIFKGKIAQTTSTREFTRAQKKSNEAFRKKYGNKTVVQISRPGINANKDIALLSITFIHVDFGIITNYYVLVNENQVWNIKQSMIQFVGVYVY